MFTFQCIELIWDSLECISISYYLFHKKAGTYVYVYMITTIHITALRVVM